MDKKILFQGSAAVVERLPIFLAINFTGGENIYFQ